MVLTVHSPADFLPVMLPFTALLSSTRVYCSKCYWRGSPVQKRHGIAAGVPPVGVGVPPNLPAELHHTSRHLLCCSLHFTTRSSCTSPRGKAHGDIPSHQVFLHSQLLYFFSLYSLLVTTANPLSWLPYSDAFRPTQLTNLHTNPSRACNRHFWSRRLHRRPIRATQFMS